MKLKRVTRSRPLLAAIGICALLAAIALASVHSVHGDSRVAHDHRAADCAGCHLLRSYAAADLSEPVRLERPTLLAATAPGAPGNDELAAPASALGSRAPPAI
ncbi:MAG: hypothetical protein FJ148_21425 [Deltaproteobacteria bacterium]|nr:hypothetical protein [Deltaproteobacteria bacterium]